MPQRGQVSTLKVRSNAPDVVGKLDDCVCPVTYALPAASIAIARPHSKLLPPRKVEYTSAVPVGFTLVMNASRELLVAPVLSNEPALVGKLGDCVEPTIYALPAVS